MKQVNHHLSFSVQDLSDKRETRLLLLQNAVAHLPNKVTALK